MQNLYNDLKNLLQQDERLVVDGKLLKNKIIELALAMDGSLLKLLLSHAGIKKHFFSDVEGVLVFDKIKFQKFISNKQFLPDSFTAFKNKIGLTANDEFITESKEVVLAWPYKDCVLEGGQTKEDAKRSEVFWNETLAPDEIDLLLSPKVLTNFKKYDKVGEHPVTEITLNDNLIIKGNNLLALHSLEKVYRGRVKLIYIDPPYNTGNDSFGYNDKFIHSTWLTFMRNRLSVAKELLSNDGSIFIQLDWNEVHYCKLLMDEIFGREFFRNEIIWCYHGPGSPKMSQFNRKHDNILWYTKGNNWVFNGDDVRMKSEVHVGGFNGEMDSSVSTGYTEKGKIPEDWWELFHTEEDFIDEMKKLYADYKNVQDDDWWKFAVASRFKVDSKKRTGYLTEKPYKLIERLIKTASNKGDIVLDFFAGSGTTGYVANYLERKFILVEQLSDTLEILKKRFKEVTYIHCDLLELNQLFIEKIQSTTSKEQLQAIWTAMQDKAFISYNVNIAAINDKATGFDDLTLEEQQQFLIEILDKNLLYVPYTSIDDKDYNISEDDKKLNRQFYSLK